MLPDLSELDEHKVAYLNGRITKILERQADRMVTRATIVVNECSARV